MLEPSLIHPKEKSLKPVVFGFSIIVWAVVVCSLIGACYGLMLIPFVLMAQAYFLGYLRGTGVRVDGAQLPELHARVVAASQKLGLASVPEVYVIQAEGALNAFATKLFSRTYVVLFSELLDKCNDDAEIDFVVAHELAHHAAGHLKSRLLTAPARLVPLLGPAYSRACEYTCDRAALFAIDSLEAGQRALAVLAAGSKAGAQLDLRAFATQQQSAGEFWPAVAELGSSHPFLPKRVAMLASWHAERSGAPQPLMPPPGRPFFAYVMAVFFGRQAVGILVVVYFIAILAAVAIPNAIKFRDRVQATATESQSVTDGPLAPSTSGEEADEGEGLEADEEEGLEPDEGEGLEAGGPPADAPATEDAPAAEPSPVKSKNAPLPKSR